MLHPGSANNSADGRSYTVSGSGENMWFGRDAFHFVWKRAREMWAWLPTSPFEALGPIRTGRHV